MVMIYAAAAPKNVSVEIISVDKAAEEWKKDEFGTGTVMLLFKDVESCMRTAQKGVPISSLQIGGIPSEPGRVTILRAVSLNQVDMDLLDEMHQKGTEIYIHIIPEEPRMDFDKIKRTFEG